MNVSLPEVINAAWSPWTAFQWPAAGAAAPSALPLVVQVGAHDGAALTHRALSAGLKEAAGSAWALGQSGVPVSTQRRPIVFVELQTAKAAAPAHTHWTSWHHGVLHSGHPVYSVVLTGTPAEGEICKLLDACLKDSKGDRQAIVVMRYDAAASVLACASHWTDRVSEAFIGPVPLWPEVAAGFSTHPLSALHAWLGWADNGTLGAFTHAAWKALGHPATALTAPGLVQAAVWQEQLARAALPADAGSQALAASMGPWLVPGMASVVADDWALRRAAATSEAIKTPVHALFLADDSMVSRERAETYVRDVFAGTIASLKVVLGVGDRLPLKDLTASLPAPKVAPAKPKAAPLKAKPTVTQKSVAPTKPVAPVSTKPVAPAKPDDLTRIEGIGPKIAILLNKAGIRTFASLAVARVADLQKILTAAGPRFSLAQPGTWPQQAGLLARGEVAKFDALVARLRGGVAA